MKLSASKTLFGILVLSVLMIVSVASDAMGQGRGRRVSHMNKKCAKFVNCHDARDGRWDGRGPNRRISYSDRRVRRHRRNRDRDRDWDRTTRRRRSRDNDRDFNRDPFWRGGRN